MVEDEKKNELKQFGEFLIVINGCKARIEKLKKKIEKAT